MFWFFRGSGVDPITWDILGRVPLKNQVLPPDTGKGVLKESGPAKTLFFLSWRFDSLEAQGVSTLQNLAVFHSLVYFLGGCHKNKVLPPDTVGFDGSSRDNWCYAWGRLDMRLGLGSSWCFDSLEAQACRPYNLGYFGEGATKESGPASRHREGRPYNLGYFGEGATKESGAASRHRDGGPKRIRSCQSTVFFWACVLIL